MPKREIHRAAPRPALRQWLESRGPNRSGRRSLANGVIVALVLLPLAAAGQVVPAPEPAPPAPPTPLVGQRDPLPGVRTGGAPVEPGAFAALAAEGYRTYVDLRAPAEVPPGFREAVRAAGLELVELPIAGEGELDLPSARALDALLEDPARRPMVVACASGNRVGALFAVRQYWLEGAGAEEALALGRAAGLTRLEPSVRLLLGLPPAPPPDAPKPD